MLPSILYGIHVPALFWLDGHYSGGCTAKGGSCTPIVQGPMAIWRRSSSDVILIDDARLFTGVDDHPTVEEVRTLVKDRFPGSSFPVKNDVIGMVTKAGRT